MRSRLRRGDLITAAVALVCATAVVFAVVVATGTRVPALNFKQSGHWVYNHTVGAVFHLDGATKQVDAKVALPDGGSGAYVTVQGANHGYTVGADGITVFDKATLSVDTTIEATIEEEPVGIEVAGGPYLVYRRAGTVVRLAVPPVVIQAGGQIADPVRTEDGTLWIRRVDSGALCGLPRDSIALRCPATVPAGHAGALTVVSGRPAFVDATVDALLVLDGQRLGEPVPLGADVPGEGLVADSDAGGRLAVVDPARGELLLIDTAAGRRGGRPAASPVRVELGDGRFSAPIAAEDAFAMLNQAAGTLVTYDLTGTRRAVVEVTEPGKRMTMIRGEDGRVYVDDAQGARTHVVDQGGGVTSVRTGEPDVPSAPPPPPDTQPPATPPVPQVAPSPPGAPAGVQARPGDASATVSWGAANPNGSAVASYHVSWTAIGGGGAGGVTTVSGNRLTATVTGLRNGTTYRMTVVAENGVGRGPGADSQPVTPSSDTPGSPTGVTATANPDGSVTVAWQAADGQGRQIRRYDVTAAASDGSTIQPVQTAATTVQVSTGLTLGASYAFTVIAINDGDVAGVPSAPSGAVQPFAPAEPPANLAAQGTDATVDLSWAAPSLNGGELVHYEVTSSGLPGQTVTGTAARFSGLSNGRTYQFQVRAVTREQGSSGGPAAQGTAATTSGTPGTTPTVDVVSATLTGDRQVTVRLVVNDRASGAVTCHVYFNGAQLWNNGCAGTQDVTVGGLANATNYAVSATGSNAYGTGGPGGTASVRTNDPPPPPPSATVSKGAGVSRPECTDPSCAFVHVSVRNLGAPYRIECWNNSGIFWTYNTNNADSEVCFYGYRGTPVWVRVNGVESNHLQWY